MCSMGVLNGNLLWAQWVCLMGKYLDATGEIIVCSTGHYWCAQLEIIGVLNGKLGAGHYWSAQWEFIICSAGHYWGAQWEFRCSTGI